jgi:hypothetical protein
MCASEDQSTIKQWTVVVKRLQEMVAIIKKGRLL